MTLSDVYVQPLPSRHPSTAYGYAPNAMWGSVAGYRRPRLKRLALAAPPLMIAPSVTEPVIEPPQPRAAAEDGQSSGRLKSPQGRARILVSSAPYRPPSPRVRPLLTHADFPPRPPRPTDGLEVLEAEISMTEWRLNLDEERLVKLRARKAKGMVTISPIKESI